MARERRHDQGGEGGDSERRFIESLLERFSSLRRGHPRGRRALVEPGVLDRAERLPRPRSAWHRREAILSAEHRTPIARRFVHLVAERAHEAFTVAEAARVLGVSRSGLERICRASFRLPPGVLINLGRVASVARELRHTDRTLRTISVGHAFPTPSVMNRFFARFVGIGPGAYRARLRTGDAGRRHPGARRTNH